MMSLKAKVEAIIYAAEEPITIDQITLLLRDVVLADLASAKENAAIEQADFVADSLATEATENVAAEESALLPELAIESAEEICPEPGPLMPEEGIQPEGTEVSAASIDNPPAQQSAPTESQAIVPADTGANPTFGENTIQEPALESFGPDSEETPAAQSLPCEPAESASVAAPETTSRKRQPKKTEQEIAEDKAVRARIREVLVELVTDYTSEDRGMEIRQVAGGFRMATKPEHHDVVRAFAKSLKPPIRLSLAALETLAVIAYKQPVTGPEIADIRGVESASVLGTLLDRKLITTAGRKQVVGRPMQYKTSKDFLLRFGLNDVNELPSMEEFSQLASDGTIEITPTEPQETPSLFEPEAVPHASAASELAESRTPEQPAPEPQTESASEPAPDTDSTDLETRDQEPPESQKQDSADAADGQPQSKAESVDVPEAEHPITGR
jgi:segregation and condensation protein B